MANWQMYKIHWAAMRLTVSRRASPWLDRLTDHDPWPPVAVVGIWTNREEKDQLSRKEDARNVQKHGVDCDRLVSTTRCLVSFGILIVRTRQGCTAPGNNAVGELLIDQGLAEGATVTADGCQDISRGRQTKVFEGFEVNLRAPLREKSRTIPLGSMRCRSRGVATYRRRRRRYTPTCLWATASRWWELYAAAGSSQWRQSYGGR